MQNKIIYYIRNAFCYYDFLTLHEGTLRISPQVLALINLFLAYCASNCCALDIFCALYIVLLAKQTI